MYSIFRKYPVRTALLVLLVTSVFAPLPAAKSDSYTEAFPTIPEAKWVGLRFIILPQSKALQHYGYQELYQDSDKEFVPLRYEDFVGRTARVVGIEHGNGPNGEKLDEADLQLESDKKTIHGDVDQGCMTDVAPASDLETAKKLYSGKTLWLASDHLNTYDAQKDTSDEPTSSAWQDAFKKVPVKQYSPVKVIDVVPGWYASVPVRFIVQEEAGREGAQGYIDVHMSNTNVPADLQAVGRFQDVFSETDPRQRYVWPTKVWSAVENKEVFPGMTGQQVRMSWGAPKEVRKLTDQSGAEQWVYDPTHILTLKDDTLAEISSQPAVVK